MAPKRIAIIGGGPAGLSAAFHLTEKAAPGDLDITVYELGWRLGGKGATGRDASKHYRIEEHGIHVFGNFYFDTWHMMKSVYDMVGNGADPCLPVKTMEAAFVPSSTVYSVENVGGCWTRDLSTMPGTNGHPWGHDPNMSKFAVILGLAKQMVTRGRAGDPGALTPEDLVTRDARESFRSVAHEYHTIVQETYLRVRNVAYGPGADLGPPPIRQGHLERERGTEPNPTQVQLRNTMNEIGERLRAATESFEILRSQAGRAEHAKLHSTMTSLDMVRSVFFGLLDADFWSWTFDLDDLDKYDYRDWLSMYGASDHTLASSSVTSIANILFAYPEGDTTREPKLSTASWLNYVLRSVLGEGAYFQFFRAGTGETVNLPVYRALVMKGVKFEFFHKLVGVRSTGTAGSRVLDELHFDRQAEALAASYDPIDSIDGPEEGAGPYCFWPSEPRWTKLKNGDLNKQADFDFEDWSDLKAQGSSPRVLKRRVDPSDPSDPADEGFDYVVWAIPPSMIPLVGDQGMKDEWAKTVTHLPTTSTQAVQLWLDQDTGTLGWDRGQLPSLTDRYASSSFPSPLSGMVAFDDLVHEEFWPEGGPEGLIYLCSQIQDWAEPLSRKEERLRVLSAASASLRLMGNFLEGARLPEKDRPDSQMINFARLYDPDPGHLGEERLEYQFARANTRPTEAYVRAPANSVPGRMDPWATGYDNVVVAGDWTYNGFNLGSFESAVAGGKLAAFALIGGWKVDDLSGLIFLHPNAEERAEQALASGRVPMIA